MGNRVALAAASTVIIIAGLQAAAPIVNFFLISLFLALVSATPVAWLGRVGVPPGLGVVLVAAVVLLLITLTTLVLGNSLANLSAALPEYQAQLRQTLTPLRGWLQQYDIELSAPTLFPELDPQDVFGLVVRLLGNVGNILSNALFMLLTAMFLLLDTASFQRKLRRISPDPATSLRRLDEVTHNVRQYLVIKTWVSLATGLGVGLWLALLGLDFPIVWGMLAFFFNFIPNIGSIIAAVPALLLALVQLGVWQALLVLVGYLVLNVVMGNVLEPRIMGRGVGLPTSIVFLALIFWGWVLGPVGMILSVPLTVILKIALASSDDTRWLAILLGSDADNAYVNRD